MTGSCHGTGHPTNATLYSMREDALLKATGAPDARAAFRDIDPSAMIAAPHMAVISAKTWPDEGTKRDKMKQTIRTQYKRVSTIYARFRYLTCPYSHWSIVRSLIRSVSI